MKRYATTILAASAVVLTSATVLAFEGHAESRAEGFRQITEDDLFYRLPEKSVLKLNREILVAPRSNNLFFQGGQILQDSQKLTAQPFCALNFRSSGYERRLQPGKSISVGSEGSTSYSSDYGKYRWYTTLGLDDQQFRSLTCYSATNDGSGKDFQPTIREVREQLLGGTFDITISGPQDWVTE